jgi:regulation of enolase protein 1 (concanavalin A-like superfamily)
MAHLSEDDGQRDVACGLYACSPKAAGFAAEFSFLEITEGRLATP